METEDGRRRTASGQRSPFSLGRRLFYDTRGQFLLFGAVMVVVVIAFLLVIPNGTQVTTQKVRAQTAADVGAFTGSIWLARSLNLNANMNIGIKSVYTWATVLTMGSALAQALYTDTVDSGVQQMGVDLVSGLFGTANPPPVVSVVDYPAAIESLNATSHWLVELQDDIVLSFHEAAAALGTEEASRNAGAYPPSPTAGGWVLVKSNDPDDSTPLLVADPVGDSLMYVDLDEIASNLESIPSGNPNIGPAVGEITVDPDSFDIYAYYGFESEWWEVEYFMHYYMDYILQTFRHVRTSVLDSGFFFFEMPGGKTWYRAIDGDTWIDPFVYQPDSWIFVKGMPGDNKYKIDTCWWVGHRIPKWYDIGDWQPGGESVPDIPKDWDHESTYFYSAFYSGADSTELHQFDRISPRRVNPNRWFHATSYIWRRAASSPFGLGPPLGGSLFPRNAVAAKSPLFTVARSVPYMAVDSPAEYDYYFTPGWDARLTPFDSVGVAEITGDTAVGGYSVHTQNSFDNLEDLRKYVLLP